MIIRDCFKISSKAFLKITSVLFCCVFIQSTFAQQSLDLRNPIINTGNSLEVGTQYKFSNVTTINNGIAVDALVTIIGSQACSLLSFDDNTSVLSTGISDFNPIIQLNDNEIINGSQDGAYIDFLFEFVLNSNNTVAVELDLEVYTYDIDGDGFDLREYVVISGFDTYTTSNPTNLEYFPVGRFEARTNETNEDINDNEAYVARAEFLSETSTFNYRAGILRDSGNGNTERLVGLAFQTIAISNPQTFDIDDDNDGVENSLDQCPGFDDNLDSDNDGIPDGCDFDSDGDGVDDNTEVTNGTDQNNPCDPTQSTGYTGFDGSNPVWRAADCDNDDVLNGEELDNGTDPYSISDDTDGDGINDDTEIANGTDQNNPCDPTQFTGYTGFDGSNPVWRAADCDNDDVLNGEELDNGTDPYSISDDTDGDGINDDTEIANGTDQNNPCDPTQSAGYTGYEGSNPIWRAADCDNDDVLNGEELDNGTDPYSISDDTDGDGINDDTEIANGTDQSNPCDPLQNPSYEEFDITNPVWQSADCDGDGINNITETNDSDNSTNPYCDGEYVSEGGTLVTSFGFNSSQFADGAPDGVFTSNFSSSADFLELSFNTVPSNSEICLVLGFNNISGEVVFNLNGALSTIINPNGSINFNPQTICIPVLEPGEQTLIITESGPGALRIDGSFYSSCIRRIDTDGDGINDAIEVANGTDQNNPCDPAQQAGYTGFNGGNPIWRAADCDNDGVLNGEEFDNGTDPYSISEDTDGDGVNDATEIANGTDQNNPCDPAQQAGYTGFNGGTPIWRAADCDNDGVLNGEEFDNGTDPYSISEDTDGDGVNDATEIANGTDQNNPCDPAQQAGYTGFNGGNPIWRAVDCDNDGVLNGEEFDNGTDPYSISEDTDGDGVNDATEIANGTDQNNPCDPAQQAGYTGFNGGNPIWRAVDCDNDGVLNGEEFDNGTDPYSISEDTDGDGIDNDTEIANNFDQNNPCDPAQQAGYTGFNGGNPIWRAADCDNDGVINGEEFDNGTDPYSISEDTDGDGIDNDTEIANNFDLNNPCDPFQKAGYNGFDGNNLIWRAADCDNDGVLNGEEFDNGTDPYSISEDTDGDGINDATEIANETDQNNPCDPAQQAGYTGFNGGNPIWRAADCDNDGVLNGEEFDNGTDPYSISEDTDGDGVNDATEIANGTDQNNPCDPAQQAGYTGFNGGNPIWRAADCDNDGVINGEEFDNGTDPYSEGIISDPLDSDGDGITNIQEELDGTNPNDACDSIGGSPPLDVNCNKPTIVSDLLVQKTNNGRFLIENIERFQDNTVKIYNRWGVLVFDAKGYNNSSIVFEGISNGRITLQQSEDLPSGVYFYVIQYSDNNKSESITGYLYINK
ncbi:gliding motility-associated C-terminal domain-containing protein [Maribacter sp. R77961]|uniref:T9SS type B sorting domain-containing protein n=1 Tax=Maribacter sp. R77961 TaxID=3093871 RepID=UPI0037CCAF9C